MSNTKELRFRVPAETAEIIEALVKQKRWSMTTWLNVAVEHELESLGVDIKRIE